MRPGTAGYRRLVRTFPPAAAPDGARQWGPVQGEQLRSPCSTDAATAMAAQRAFNGQQWHVVDDAVVYFDDVADPMTEQQATCQPSSRRPLSKKPLSPCCLLSVSAGGSHSAAESSEQLPCLSKCLSSLNWCRTCLCFRRVLPAGKCQLARIVGCLAAVDLPVSPHD